MTRGLSALFALAFSFGLASTSSADKLQDFKDAVAANPGCKSIPYKNLSDACDGRGNDMHDWCDGGRGPVSCDQGATRVLKENLDREQKNYQQLKDRKHDLEDKKYHSNDDTEKAKLQTDIDAVSRQIDDSERAINGIKADIDRRSDLVRKTIATIETCIDHRRAIMNIFAEALDRVRGESDENIKPLATQLRDRFEASKRGHEIAITDKSNARDNCKSETP